MHNHPHTPLTVKTLDLHLAPNAIQQFLTTGELIGFKIDSDILLILTILLWVPFVTAFLSVTLKNPINRWVNIIMAVVWLGLGFIDVPNLMANPASYLILLWLTGYVAKVLIIWYAWESMQ